MRPFKGLLVIVAAGLLAGIGSAWTRVPVNFSLTRSRGAVHTSTSITLNQALAGYQQPERFIMVTVRRGYLLTTSHHLWWTNDAGRRWTRVGVVPMALNLTLTGGQIWAQTPHRLWTRTLGVADWASYPLPTEDFNPAQIDLINGKDGWLITSQGMAAGAQSLQIWVTYTDGRQWTAIRTHGLPYQGSKLFAFRTLQDGWMFGTDSLGLGVVQFYRTETGGAHWSPVSLVLPAQFRHQIVTVTGLHRAGTTNALLVATSPSVNEPHAVSWTIYHRTTSTPWKHGMIETTSPEANSPTVTWTGSTAWVIHGSQLWRGSDWGRHWQLVHHWRQSIHALTWVTARPSLGYAFVGGHLIHTTTGGITWSRPEE